MTVSIVIPVRDDPPVIGAVASVLDALPEGAEIMVVDNGSQADFRALLDRLPVPVRVIDEPQPGPAAARNAGVRASRGDVILFLDADCIASAGWAQEALRGLEATGADVLGGSSSPRAITRVQRAMARHTHGAHPPTLASADYVDTKNLAVRRSVFEQVTFDEDLLRFEDHAFGYAARDAGFRLAVWAPMHVSHEPEPHIDRYIAKCVAGGWARGRVAASRGQGAPARPLGHRERVRIVLRQLIVSVARGRPWVAKVLARLAVRSGRPLERAAGVLPIPVISAAIGVLAWCGWTAGLALYRAGLPAVTVSDALAGRFPAAR